MDDDLSQEQQRPGDEAPADENSAGENICPVCGGSGEKDGFGFGFQIETPPARSTNGCGRSAGSCSWSGIFNTYFWIDFQHGIGVTVLMQFLPAHDAGAIEILTGVERIVYEARN